MTMHAYFLCVCVLYRSHAIIVSTFKTEKGGNEINVGKGWRKLNIWAKDEDTKEAIHP
jgi:hypothetical protein